MSRKSCLNREWKKRKKLAKAARRRLKKRCFKQTERSVSPGSGGFSRRAFQDVQNADVVPKSKRVLNARIGFDKSRWSPADEQAEQAG